MVSATPRTCTKTIEEKLYHAGIEATVTSAQAKGGPVVSTVVLRHAQELAIATRVLEALVGNGGDVERIATDTIEVLWP